MKLDFRQRLLATTLLVSASMVASPAFAQDAPPPADDTAQPAAEAPAPADQPAAEEIVVTGTRIPQPNLTSAAPVTVLTSADIKLQGTTRTEDLINSLPQSFATQGSNISNGSTGTASVNLRNLGSARTMVLINGRRLMPGDPRLGSIADINFVPSSLVKRVDVLTGGASSTYGADAVAGVVNFIMDTTFTGLRIDAQASTFMHDNDVSDSVRNANTVRGFVPPHGLSTNGGAQDISAAFGTGFDDDRGHIMAYATYRKQNAVLQATRDYSFCALAARTVAQGGLGSKAAADPAGSERDFNCGGSATSANGTFFTNIGTFQIDGNQLAEGFTPFNYGPYNFYQRPDERYTFGAFAEYEISSAAKPYLEAMFMHDQSNSRIAPSGNFFATNTINCDNPLLSAQQLSIFCAPATYVATDANVTDGNFDSTFGNLLGQGAIFGPDPDGAGPLKRPLLGFGVVGGVAPATVFTDALGNNYNKGLAYTGRRNVEGGGREDNLEHTAYRIVGGIRGDLDRGLSYDAYYQFGTTRLSQVYRNDFSITRIGRAMDVVDDGSGNPVCRSVLDGTDPACVPYNIFAEGGVSAEALNYLQNPLLLTGHVNETIANLNFTIQGGEYGVQLPWAERGVGLNVGAEYRKEALSTQPDASFISGDGAGQGAATLPVEGDFDVRELFAELDLPIVQNGFIEELTIGAGYRYSDYKVQDHSFSTDTYKVTVELAPVEDIRFRASYNRAVRAPNVVELFSATNVGLGGTDDPCAGDTPQYTEAQCANTGVTADQYGFITENPANQYNAQFGGNVNLNPEKADTYTVGVVVQPRWVPGLALTVDWFNIKIDDLIGTLAFQTIMDNCATTGAAATCSLIHRQPGNGSLWLSPAGFIETSNINIGGLKTKGIDLNVTYSRQLFDAGTLNLSMVGTWLNELTVDTGLRPDDANKSGTYDCSGFYGNTCGTPSPEWRHKLRAGFTFKSGIGISAQWRYFGKVDLDTRSSDCDLGKNYDATPGVCGITSTDPAFAPRNAKIGSQSYFDLSLSARVADRYSFRVGMNNIFDKEPPIVGGEVSNAPFGNGNTYPQVYDALGRYLFAGVTVDF